MRLLPQPKHLLSDRPCYSCRERGLYALTTLRPAPSPGGGSVRRERTYLEVPMSDIMHDPVSVTPADGPPTRRAIPPPPRGCGPAGWTTADIDPIAEVRDIAIGELVADGWGALAEEVSAGRSGTSALRELADNASPAAELAVRKLADVERLAGVLPTPAPEAPVCGKEWPPRPGHITGERCLREPGHEEGRCSPMHHRVFSAEEVEANVRPGASTVPPAATDARAEILAGLAEAERSAPDDADTTPPSDRAADAWDSAIDGIQALAEGILWDARALAQEGHPDAAALAMLGYAIRGAGESAHRGIREGIEAWAAARMPRRGRQ